MTAKTRRSVTTFLVAPAVVVVGALAGAAGPRPAYSEPIGSHGPASSAVTAASQQVSAPRRKRNAMVVKGRTKKKRAMVRIRGWKRKRHKWVLLKQVRSKRHRYRTRVSLRGVADRPLKVKVRKQKVRRVAIPERRAQPAPAPVAPDGAATPAPAEPCGGAHEGHDGTVWTCTFSDEFSGDSLDRDKWMPQTSGYTTGKEPDVACYTDDPEHVSVGDERLRLTLTRGEPEPCADAARGETRFFAGSVSTYRLFSQRYGRFEARTRNTDASVSGLHEAFWLWPDDREVDVSKWPSSGEIDVAETYAAHPDLAIPFLHTSLDYVYGLIPWDIGFWATSNTSWSCEAHRGEWNTYAVEWRPKKIEIFVNDELCLRNTSGDKAFQERYIIAFTQGIGGDQNLYHDQTPLPATYEVDYVRVWQ